MVRELYAQATLTALISVAPPAESLGLALGFLRATTGAEAAEVFLAEPHGLGMVLTGHCGLFRNAFFQIPRFAAGEGFPGLVFERGEPIATRCLPEDPRYLRTRVKERGFRSFLCVPFFGPRGVLGSLDVAYRHPDPDLEGALRLLTWAGASLSLALQARVAPFDAGVSADASSADGLREGLEGLLRRMLAHVVVTGNAQGGTLFILRREGGLSCHLREGTIAEDLCPVLESASSQACPALSGHRGIMLQGPRRSWPLACQQAAQGGQTTYCLPLLAGDEEVGVMRIGYQRPGPTPPTQHLVELMTLAGNAADTIRKVAGCLEDHRRAEDLQRCWLQGKTGLAVPAVPSPAPRPAPARRSGDTGIADLPELEIRCFGPFELRRLGTLVRPDRTPRRKALTILKILLTHGGRPVSKDVLVELLWPEVAPAAGFGRLYVLIHALRRLVEPSACAGRWAFIKNDGDSYYFDATASCSVDVEQFKSLVSLGKRAQAAGNLNGAITAWESATQLYRGDFMEDEPFTDWCWPEREHLRETCLDVLSSLAAHYAGRGEWNKSVERYRQALRRDCLREQNHLGLMRALFASGRRDEALRQYQACRDLLRRELDVAPLPETERLYLQIKGSAQS